MNVFDCECGKCGTRIARFYGKLATKTAVQCPECQEINNVSPPFAAIREARHVEITDMFDTLTDEIMEDLKRQDSAAAKERRQKAREMLDKVEE